MNQHTEDDDKPQPPSYMDLKRRVAMLEGQLVQARAAKRLAETAERLARERVLYLERESEALRNSVPLLRDPGAFKSAPHGNLKLSKERFLLLHQLSQALSHATPAELARAVGMSDSVARDFLNRTYTTPSALAAYRELGLVPKTYEEIVSAREQRAHKGAIKPRRVL